MERRNVGLIGPGVADAVFLYDRRVPRELWTALHGGYDVVIDTEQWYYLSAIVAWLTRAPVRCGFDTNRRGRLFTHPVAYDEAGHEARVFLSLYEALAGEPAAFEDDAVYLTVDPADRLWADSALRAVAGHRLMVMAPAAPTRERQWDPRRYAEVASRFARDGWAIVLVGTPGDRPLCAAVAGGHDEGHVLNLAGRTTIGQTAAVISRAAVYLSSDGGLLHAAHALGIPTVGLFGAGIAAKWAPRGARARTVRHALPCSPCTRFGYAPPCPYGVECMQRISVDEVLGALAGVTAV
jgi:ADP-heptose:LPS heptosyltransferase